MRESEEIPAGGCPICRHRLDRATALNGKDGATPGDFTVCLYCGSMLKFDEHMMHSVLSLEELDSLDASLKAQLQDVSYAIRLMRRGPGDNGLH